MSAKEFHQKPVIHIGVLPDDVLGEVLRHATWLPYGIEPSNMVGKRLQSSNAKDLMRKYRTSLVTRRYLVRVCKKWHRLAFLYLYEWVLASRLKNLKGTIQTLEQLHLNTGTYPGWCTKRLDIDFQISGGETSEERDQEGSLVLRLLHAVPNLRVLTLGRCHDPIWTQPYWSHTCCPKLEFFNTIAGPSGGVFSPESWMHFVHSHPNLIAINAPIFTILKDLRLYIIQTSPTQTHALKEVTLGYPPHFCISSSFTSLSRLNLDPFKVDAHFTDPQWCHYLIMQPLPSLTALQFSFSEDEDAFNFDFKIVEPLFQFLPNLHRIDLVLPSWQGWPSYALPSGVSVFGLRVCSTKPSKETVGCLLINLNKMVLDAVSPLRVQFLDDRTMQSVCMHEEYVVRVVRAENLLQSWLDPDGNVHNLHTNPS